VGVGAANVTGVPALAVYEYAAAVAAGVVTPSTVAVTGTDPTAPPGTVAVQEVVLAHTTFPATLEPKWKMVPPGFTANPVPVMVSDAPPILGPEVDESAVTVGVGAATDCVVVANELEVKCMDVKAVWAADPVRLREVLTLLQAILKMALQESKEVGNGFTPTDRTSGGAVPLGGRAMDPLNDFDGANPLLYEASMPTKGIPSTVSLSDDELAADGG
jgi:hypothetical protein